MSFLTKILGHEDKMKVEYQGPVCPHTTLLPRWDKIDDMGKENLATGYACQSCSETFSPEAARSMRLATTERLRI